MATDIVHEPNPGALDQQTPKLGNEATSSVSPTRQRRHRTSILALIDQKGEADKVRKEPAQASYGKLDGFFNKKKENKKEED